MRTNDYNNWGSLSATWTDEGPSFVGATPEAAQPYNFGDFFRGGASPPTGLYLTDAVIKDHEALSALLRGVRDPLNGFNYTPLEDRGGAIVNGRTTRNPNLIDGYFFANEIYKNSEETLAGYARADFGHNFGNGMSLVGQYRHPLHPYPRRLDRRHQLPAADPGAAERVRQLHAPIATADPAARRRHRADRIADPCALPPWRHARRSRRRRWPSPTAHRSPTMPTANSATGCRASTSG